MSTDKTSINAAVVRKVARLARLKVIPTEEETLAQELSGILKMIGELDSANTDGVEPLTAVVDMPYPSRPDAVTDGNMQDKITVNAPESTAGFFVVQKFVE
jgi:aspartyl-tRNA(Asn)/glutamyl-tRNA(Gln) amidotransferase subunit C